MQANNINPTNCNTISACGTNAQRREGGLEDDDSKKAFGTLYKPLALNSQYIDSYYLCAWHCCSCSLCLVLKSKFHSRC